MMRTMHIRTCEFTFRNVEGPADSNAGGPSHTQKPQEKRQQYSLRMPVPLERKEDPQVVVINDPRPVHTVSIGT